MFSIIFKDAAGNTVHEFEEFSLTFAPVSEYDVRKAARSLLNDGKVPDTWETVELDHDEGLTVLTKQELNPG